jgi:ribosomal protein S18 acetylase RimI-like enzyme
MAQKMRGEGIALHYSVGAFEDNQLVGFILHGYDVVDGVKMVYNAGTGVIPSFRGQGITRALYQYLIPLLQNVGIHTHLLEVIDNNFPAINIYKSTGFRNVRTLCAFKTTAVITEGAAVQVKEIDALPLAAAFYSSKPSWQNSTASVERDRESHRLIGAFQNEALVGFAAYMPATGRVRQCAVHASCRRQKVGTALFYYMQQNSGTKSLVITGVDEAYEPAMKFFGALHVEPFLRLHEMVMVVK